MNSIVIPEITQEALVAAELIEKATEYARASKAESTRRTYSSVWAIFTAWCSTRNLTFLPATPETIIGYIADQAERLRPTTIRKHLAAISQAHKMAGFASPVNTEPVRMVMQGLRRTKGTASKPKRALRVEHVKSMVAGQGDDLIVLRDRILVLLGFVGGMRRSEIVGLDVADVAFEPEGLVVTIRRSKRDQEGKGRQIGVPRGRKEDTCPVRALRKWLDVSKITTGAIFVRLDAGAHGERLSCKSVALIVKKTAERAGLDPELFSGHSLRRGFCTEAARAGASERDIARTSGHKSMAVLRGYVEAGTLFEACAAKVLDL